MRSSVQVSLRKVEGRKQESIGKRGRGEGRASEKPITSTN